MADKTKATKRVGGLKRNSTLNPKLLYSTEVDGAVFHMKGERLIELMAETIRKEIVDKYMANKSNGQPLPVTKDEAISDKA